MEVQNHILGLRDQKGHPAYLHARAFAYAMEMEVACYLDQEGEHTPIVSIEIRASETLDRRSLLAWLARGNWNFESAASSRIAAACRTVAPRLPCPLNIYAQDESTAGRRYTTPGSEYKHSSTEEGSTSVETDGQNYRSRRKR